MWCPGPSCRIKGVIVALPLARCHTTMFDIRPLLAYAPLALNLVAALENGLARTPQMGWNTWNYFGCNIKEDTILSAAQALVNEGLKDLGYICRCPP
jgi:hypothetical protein